MNRWCHSVKRISSTVRKKVEAMEKQLKSDASKECLKFEKLLIHSESDTNNLEAKSNP